MEIYKNMYKPVKINKIQEIKKIQENLINLKKKIKEEGENLNNDSVMASIESALINAIKVLGATDEVTGQLIDVATKVEGGNNEVKEDNEKDVKDLVAPTEGYKDENNSPMNVNMNEQDGESLKKNEMTSAEEGCEGKAKEGITPFTQYTDDGELDESEEMDREDNLRKTGQYQLPSGKVNENVNKRYERRFK